MGVWQMTTLHNKLIVAISSRALFNLDESHHIFETQGIDAYQKYQISNENNILEPGVAFLLVKKLLALKDPKSNEALVEVILLSRNNADTGLRIFNSIQHHQLNIIRAAFTNGESTYRYVTAFNSHLFLSANPNDVLHALEQGCAAATILNTNNANNCGEQLRIAFDGDAVIFSDEAERIFQSEGLDAFAAKEFAAAKKPLAGGPFKGFLAALHQIQTRYPADQCPIRTALVTARSAPAHERVIRTLREWNIRIDEALFLGGLNKGEFLRAFGADFYFDDQQGHCDNASVHVATGHVPHGIVNEK
jgi:5'-nucleotidase